MGSFPQVPWSTNQSSPLLLVEPGQSSLGQHVPSWRTGVRVVATPELWSPQAVAMDDDFVGRFAAVGSAGEVAVRLRARVAAGVDRLYLSFPAPGRRP